MGVAVLVQASFGFHTPEFEVLEIAPEIDGFGEPFWMINWWVCARIRAKTVSSIGDESICKLR